MFLGTYLMCLSFMFLPSHGRNLEIAPGVYSFTQDGGLMSMFVLTDDSVVVVEPGSTSHSTQMLMEIREITDLPIKYLIYSHDHWDHTSGGQVFKDVGAQLIAHCEAVDSIKANEGPDQILPDLEWCGNDLYMLVGGQAIRLKYLGINHGNGMTVVQLVSRAVIYVADLVTPHRILFTIVPDFNIKEWERSLEEIINMYWTKGIFSHSGNADTLPAGTKDDATANLQLIRDIRQAVHDELKKGTNAFAIPNVIKLPQYEGWALYPDFLPMNAWRILLDEMMGPYPWRKTPGYVEPEVEALDVSNTVLH